MSIKFKTSLADIPNPHPVLFVGEIHDDYIMKLYLMHSLKYLNGNDYKSLVFENHPIYKDYFREFKDDWKKHRDHILNDYHENQDFSKNHELAVFNMCLEADSLQMSSVFAETRALSWSEIALLELYQEASSHECRNRAEECIGDIAEKYNMKYMEVLPMVVYAWHGEKTFSNFLQTVQMSQDIKEDVSLAGQAMKRFFINSKKDKDILCKYVPRDNAMAEVIATTTEKKAVCLNGQYHIAYRGNSEIDFGRKSLPDVLEEQYNIASTRVTMVNLQNLAKAEKTFDILRIKKELLDLSEAMAFSESFFSLSAMEVLCFLSPNMQEEGTYDIRNLNIGVDYLVALPAHGNKEVLENIKSEIRHQLKL